MQLKIYPLNLPAKRPYSWRAFAILVALYFLGNLAGVPLLRATQMPIEPVWFWILITAISAVLIGISLLLGSRTALGAPYLEGLLDKAEIADWFKGGLALTALVTACGMPISVLINANIDPTTYPASWQLVLASAKAGVVEEIINRLFLVTLFVWLGSLVRREDDGRPTRMVYWAAIILAGLIFGLGHVDEGFSTPGAPLGLLTIILIVSTGLGIIFGWMFWRLGLEWAIIAHFFYDAVLSALVMPVYFSKNMFLWIAVAIGILAAIILSWRYLRRRV